MMNRTAPQKSLKQSLQRILHKISHCKITEWWFKVLVSFFLTGIYIRILEFVFMTWIQPISEQSFTPELLGLISDMAAIARVSSVVILLSLIFFWNKVAVRIFLHASTIFYLLLSSLALNFYLIAFVPLDQSLFTYSIDEIIETINATGFNLYGIVILISPIVVYITLYKHIVYKRCYGLIGISSIVLMSFFYNYARFQGFYPNDLIKRNMTISKADYFLYKSFQFLSSEQKTDSISDEYAIRDYLQFRLTDGFYNISRQQEINTIPIKDIPEIFLFPLLHINTFNPLEEHFLKFENPPNVAIIIVESLGSRFVCPDSNMISITPFLDSLANESLYWPNCYSSSERTFGALPTILGSLPYGEKGFSEIQNYPEHLSITSILKDNGYYTSFFYGGWTYFQGMSRLLGKQGIDLATHKYPSNYVPMEKNEKGFSWGFSDGEMFRRSLEIIDSIKTQPMFNLYLTLSTHSPFAIPNKDQYKDRINRELDTISDNVSSLVRKNIEPYVALLYADDCLRNIFKEYQKRGIFDNTIFIITGDHHMHEVGSRNELEIFHVPLIIHSPLIKEPKRFKAIVGHQDIAPSLLNLLSGMGHVKYSKTAHWMGYGLEPNDQPNRKFMPLMRNNKQIDLCIWGNYFYSQNILFHLSSGSDIIPVKDMEAESAIKKRLTAFQRVNNYTTNNHFIISPRYLYDHQEVKDVWEYSNNSNPLLKEANSVLKFGEFVLDDTYEFLLFENQTVIEFDDTTKNSNFVIRVYSTDDKQTCYFFLQNDNYVESRFRVNIEQKHNFVRKVYNQYFTKGSRIVFYYEGKKATTIKELNIRVYGGVQKSVRLNEQ